MPTVSYGISNTADDVLAAPGLGTLESNVANGLSTPFSFYVGLRFVGVAVPQGATITSATLTLKKDAANSSAGTWGAIKGVAADNAPAWTTTDPSVASKTTQSKTVIDGATQNYDVAAIVSTIVGRSGWSSGNALAFAGDPTGSSAVMAWVDYSVSSTDCAQLSITYETGGGPATINADFNATLGALTVASTGTVVSNRTANLAATLGSLTLNASATSAVSANLNKSFDAFALTSDASVSLSAAAFLTFDPATLQAAAETSFAEISAELNASLGELILEATANAIVLAEGELPFGATVLSASASSVDQIEAEANLDLGSLTLQSSSAVSLNVNAELTFGDLTTTASAQAPVAAVMVAELGPLTVSANAGAINQIVAHANLDFGAAALEASGAITVSALATLNLSALMASADAIALVQGGLIAELASIELASQLTADIMADLSVQFDALKLTAIAINGELPKVLAERRAVLTGEDRTAKLSRSNRRAVLIKTARKAQ